MEDIAKEGLSSLGKELEYQSLKSRELELKEANNDKKQQLEIEEEKERI